jgi:hypothetical protein
VLAEVTEFSRLRQEVSDLAGVPGIPWNRLAAEMKANIHVGLAAGECVRDSRLGVSSFLGMRAAVACASVAVLLLASLLLERPAPVAIAEQPVGISLRAIGNGVEVA